VQRLGYSLDDRGSVLDRCSDGIFSHRLRVHTVTRIHPASYAMAPEGFTLQIKRPRREAVHSPPSSAKVKCEYISLVCLHGVVLN